MTENLLLNPVTDDYFIQVYKRYKVNFTHGKGCYLYDVNGKEYLDFLGGIAVNALGHVHPLIIETAIAQMKKLVHISNLFYNTPSILLAQKLTEKFHPASKAFFCNSGTEAAEFALKICRAYGKKYRETKTKIVAVKGSFHGRTTGALTMTGPREDSKKFAPLIEGVSFAEFNDPDSLRQCVNEDTAGIFIEPIQGEGGIRAFSNEFLQTARDLADRSHALLVFDEVQCGVGRTGYLFTQDYHHVQPDIVYLAKSLGVGFPIGALLAVEHVAQIIQPGDHGCTFGGNPFVCSIALKFLELLEQENLLDQIHKNSAYFMSELRKLEFSQIKDVRGYGYMIGLELVSDPVPVCEKLLENGLVCCAAQHNTLRFLPPYISTQKEFDRALVIIRKVFTGLS